MANDLGLAAINGFSGFKDGMNLWSGLEDAKQARRLRDSAETRAGEQHDMYRQRHEQALKQGDQALRAGEQNLKMGDLNYKRELSRNEEEIGAVMAKNAIMFDFGEQLGLTEKQRHAVQIIPQLDMNYLMADETRTGLTALKELGIQATNPATAQEALKRINAPENLAHLNRVFTEVQTGASDGRKRTITSMIPGPEEGTVLLGLAVENDPKQRPLTNNRSSDPNDDVMVVRIADLQNKVDKSLQVIDLMNTKEGRATIVKRYAPDQADRYSDVKLDPVSGLFGQTNLNTNKFEAMGNGKIGKLSGFGGGGGGGKETKRIQLERYYINERGMDPESARRWAMTADLNPADFIRNEVENHMKMFSGPEGMMLSAEDLKRERAQATTAATELYQKLAYMGDEGEPGVMDNDTLIQRAGEDTDEDPNEVAKSLLGGAPAPAGAQTPAQPQAPQPGAGAPGLAEAATAPAPVAPPEPPLSEDPKIAQIQQRYYSAMERVESTKPGLGLGAAAPGAQKEYQAALSEAKELEKLLGHYNALPDWKATRAARSAKSEAQRQARQKAAEEARVKHEIKQLEKKYLQDGTANIP